MTKIAPFLLFLLLFCPKNAFSAPKLLNNYQNMNILAETLLNDPQPDKKIRFIQFFESEGVIGKLHVYAPSPNYARNTVKLMGSSADGVIYVYYPTKRKKLDLKQIIFIFLLDGPLKMDIINHVSARIFDQIPEDPKCDPIGCTWKSEGFRISIMKDQNSGSATVMIAESNLFR